MASSLQIGRLGEQIASEYLTSKGLHIIDRNFRTKYGEIDLIIKKDKKIIFVEVKTRIGDQKGKPYEAVTRNKYGHLKLAAELYVLKNKLKEYKLSVHVVSIILTPDLKVEKIDHFEDVLL